MLKISARALAGLFCLSLTANCFAQFGMPAFGDGIKATGTESVPIKPEKLRLVMWIKAQGADAKSAIVKLGEHRERVKKELEGMKAAKESIAFSATRVAEGSGDPNAAQMRAMQMQMMRAQGGGAGEVPTPPKVFTATCALKAEWPLPVKEGDALAMLPATLQEQIATRDLAGEKNKPELKEEDREQFEEMEAAMAERYSYQSNESQGPQITFIATVLDEVSKKATEAAFKKAAKEAATLSAASGVKLGKLNQLTTSTASFDPTMYYASRGYGNQEAMPSSLLGDQTGIVSEANPDDLNLTVIVNVSYAIEN